MHSTYQNHDVVVPKNVTAIVKSRVIKVTGPRGSVEKAFKHANVQILRVGKVVRVQMWHGNKKELASIRTVASHIQNMIKGVTDGVLYKMRAVHAHFPINVNITDGGKHVEMRNFLGQRFVRRVKMLEGVEISASKDLKDEYIFTGIDIQNVSQSAASVNHALKVRGKDIRKFLDGIYVSQKTTISAQE